jgi:hypothetical protein
MLNLQSLEQKCMQKIQIKALQNLYNYASYKELIDQLMAENKTTGPNQEQWLIDYAKLNIARMRKWEKKVDVLPEVKLQIESIATEQIWLTITEGWCGDAAQIVPVIEKLAQLNPKIQHQIILRDEHLAIMDQFLTNGGRAIPITIVMDKNTHEVLTYWGPRPSGAQEIMNRLKSNPQLTKEDVMEDLHTWYAKNNTYQIQSEFTTKINSSLSH